MMYVEQWDFVVTCVYLCILYYKFCVYLCVLWWVLDVHTGSQ